MSTATNPVSSILQEIQQLSGVAVAVAPGDANQINKVTGFVQLGVATIPIAATFLGDLFHMLGSLFHHTAAAQAQAVATQASQVSQPISNVSSTVKQ